MAKGEAPKRGAAAATGGAQKPSAGKAQPKVEPKVEEPEVEGQEEGQEGVDDLGPGEERGTAEGAVGPDAWEIPMPEDAELGGVQPGVYLSVCTEEPEETLSSKGDPQTQFHFEIRDPEFPELDGRSGNLWCSRKSKSWWLLGDVLNALGVPWRAVKDTATGKYKSFRFDPLACVNQPCKTVWEKQTFRGRARTRIVRVVGPEEEVESLEGAAEGLGEDFGGDELPFE